MPGPLNTMTGDSLQTGRPSRILTAHKMTNYMQLLDVY